MYTLSVEDHSGAAETNFLQVVTAVAVAGCVSIVVPVVVISFAETAKVAVSTTTEVDLFGAVIELSVMTVPDVLIVPGVASSTENTTDSFDGELDPSRIAKGGTFTLPEV